MSVTTTANPTTQAIVRLLADYDLTQTGEDVQPAVDTTLNSRPKNGDVPSITPTWWPTDHKDIPAYRPINYHLDAEQRPWGSSPAETAFVWTMLHGVGVVGSIRKLWAGTGGRFNDSIFTFSIGGER